MTPSDAMQIEFARLAGDAGARERFRHEPARESAPLAHLAPHAVDGYADALVRKRLHEVAHLLPRSARERDFVARFTAYAACHPIGGNDRHRRDAIAFARELGTPLARAECLDFIAVSRVRFRFLARMWAMFRSRIRA